MSKPLGEIKEYHNQFVKMLIKLQRDCASSNNVNMVPVSGNVQHIKKEEKTIDAMDQNS